jgi:hypothetical protein
VDLDPAVLVNADPNADPGLEDQKMGEKITAEKIFRFFYIKNWNLGYRTYYLGYP